MLDVDLIHDIALQCQFVFPRIFWLQLSHLRPLFADFADSLHEEETSQDHSQPDGP